MRTRNIRHARHLFCFSLLIVLCGLLTRSPVARADGGAPNLAYISGTPTGVSVIDVRAERISRLLHVTGDPQDILLSLDGSLLYTTQPSQNQVAVINAQTGMVVCAAPVPFHPSLLTQTPSGDMLFAAGGTVVQAIDPQSCVVTHRFQVHAAVAGLTTSFFPGAFPGTVGTYQLWVASRHALTVFDTGGTELASFPAPANPEYLLVPPQSAFLYLTTRQGTVVAFDIGTRAFTTPLLTGGVFGPMDFDDSTGEVYVPDLAHRQLDVLSPLEPTMSAVPNAPARIIRLSSAPVCVAIASGGQLGFVALQDGRVALLDIPGRLVIVTITVGGDPHFIITGLYPPTSASTSSRLSARPAPALFVRWQLGALVMGTVLLLLGVLGAGLAALRRRRRRGKRSRE